MIVVIQCASTKQPGAAYLRGRDGRRVMFVARPELAPHGGDLVWARPDDLSDAPDTTWRARLEAAQVERGTELLQASELYRPVAFGHLARTFGPQQLFILSAGWGLVRADYRLPQYDITFSKQAEPYKRRLAGDPYHDFNQLPVAADEPVVFLGGRDYLPLLAKLTRDTRTRVIVPSRCEPASAGSPVQQGHLLLVPYPTTAKTNWHYGCAEQLCANPTFLERAAS